MNTARPLHIWLMFLPSDFNYISICLLCITWVDCFAVFSIKYLWQDENGEYQIPVDAELETKRNIVLYDEKTSHILSEGGYNFKPCFSCKGSPHEKIMSVRLVLFLFTLLYHINIIPARDLQ